MDYSVLPIPDSLRDNLAYGLGEAAAERWLDYAIARAAELMQAWDLRPDQVLAGGSESLCVKCDDADGAPMVLKLPASVAGGAAEIAALRAWGGDGAARVIREEPGESAMLMNFLGWVGRGAFTLGEVLELADRLHAADTSSYAFPSVEDNLARRLSWAEERFSGPGDQEARTDLASAEKLLAELLYDDEPQVLLHGDLQPKNLIVSAVGLAAVDPMPSVGPAIFDIAFWVVKCRHDHPLTQCESTVLEQRPQIDDELLRRWCWALSVLESRPYLGAANGHRTDYIDAHRDLVTR